MKVDLSSVELAVITYPESSRVQYAEREDGTALTKKELDEFQDQYAEICWEDYIEWFHCG